MEAETESPEKSPEKRRSGFSGKQVALIVLAVVLIAVVATFWTLRTYVYPSAFEPVTLNAREEQVLDAKISQLSGGVSNQSEAGESDQSWLREAPYDEAGANRRVEFSEKEINALIARDPELGRRVAIDLSDNLASARILIDVPPDFPVMPGRTIRVSAGLELAYAADRPVVKLQGVSVMGVPLPNAWLGNMKNIDLVNQFGNESGFWQSFSEGIDFVRVEDGRLSVKLKE
ncbi:MAG: arginine N-succinyltransferase [Gammaproteobacteria bacterium]|nr:arginine N-succinyltransferase [Gammaproteobacteria bacterium]